MQRQAWAGSIHCLLSESQKETIASLQLHLHPGAAVGWEPSFCSEGNGNFSPDSYFPCLFISLGFQDGNREEEETKMTREYPRLSHQQ